MALERTLVLVKHEIIAYAKEILTELDELGKRKFDKRIGSLSEEIMREHYLIHKDKLFYEAMIKDHVC
jgi:nucleoside diphosphate kinase